LLSEFRIAGLLLGFQSRLTSGSFGGLRSGQGNSLTSFIGQLGGFSLGDAGIASHPDLLPCPSPLDGKKAKRGLRGCSVAGRARRCSRRCPRRCNKAPRPSDGAAGSKASEAVSSEPVSEAKFAAGLFVAARRHGLGTLRHDRVADREGLRIRRLLLRLLRHGAAFGTNVLFDARIASRQGAILAKMVRWYTPAEALQMATADNGQLMALSGFIDPYPGKLGVVEEGALADLLLIDGNPLENIKLIEDPDKHFLVIMKDGEIYKNILPK
jgi:hypothetical protein